MEYTQDGFGSNQSLDSKVQKLVILFVFDKMAIPLAETTLLDICSSDNNWLSYMECKQYLAELLDTNLVYRVPKSDMLGITQDGVSCSSQKFPPPFATKSWSTLAKTACASKNANHISATIPKTRTERIPSLCASTTTSPPLWNSNSSSPTANSQSIFTKAGWTRLRRRTLSFTTT